MGVNYCKWVKFKLEELRVWKNFKWVKMSKNIGYGEGATYNLW